MKILTIVGARPQFVKAAAISQAIKRFNENHDQFIQEEILHTGQHYDDNLSAIFFSEMKIPQPKYLLNCSGMSHGEMTGKMLIEIEPVLKESKPDWVLVYGDTNSTLAGALCASKINIPVIHVEAGLRSFNKTMPEEINRILTDHLSGLLFCPTFQAVKNLHNEGITKGVHHIGDVMYDAAVSFSSVALKVSNILNNVNLSTHEYYLLTIHRAENTNHPERLSEIIKAVLTIASDTHVIFPVHPRTLLSLKKYGLYNIIIQNPSIKMIDPVSFLDMIVLEKNAKCILTDSGGIQKESYFHRVPCVTLREETEWIETVNAGWNQIAGYKQENILKAVLTNTEKYDIPEYGNGSAADNIIKLLWN